MTKGEIVYNETSGIFDEHELGITGLANAMEVYAKQEAIAYSIFKREYQHIESMNVRHDQEVNFAGGMYSWIGANDDVIWEAYKRGEQLKPYFKK